MKNVNYMIIMVLIAVLTGCEKFTDVKPKGKNVLDKVTDLDQLLNYEYAEAGLDIKDACMLVNDMFPSITNIPNLLSNPAITMKKVLFTWDEETDRAALATSDSKYETWYKIIGSVANPVLLMADKASGDTRLAARIKAEAYVLRAYFQYLAVNFYAKAYDPATAATDPGVPYLRENDLLSVPNKKYTVKEVYDLILKDLTAAFALNSLPDVPANLMRIGKPFAWAVQAKVLMSMHDFDGALQAANNCLALKNIIDDHRNCIAAGVFSRPEMKSAEDLFYTNASLLVQAFTDDMRSSFESGSILLNYYKKANGSNYYGLPVDAWGASDYYSGCGLTTVDMYLIQAECKIRSGRMDDLHEAVNILNKIREYRIIPEQYTPLEASSKAAAFNILKNISRTENFYTCKNYINLKRWNKDDEYKTTLQKTITYTLKGKTESFSYSLQPDSPLWIFPFPQNATTFNPNLTQNYK